MFNMLNEIVNYTNWVKSEPGGGNLNRETCAVLTDQGINIKKKKTFSKTLLVFIPKAQLKMEIEGIKYEIQKCSK